MESICGFGMLQEGRLLPEAHENPLQQFKW